MTSGLAVAYSRRHNRSGCLSLLADTPVFFYMNGVMCFLIFLCNILVSEQ